LSLYKILKRQQRRQKRRLGSLEYGRHGNGKFEILSAGWEIDIKAAYF
jgi:hypothetical protein